MSLFEEKLGVGDPDSTARTRRHFTGLDLHPEIARAAAKLFRDGHYANAIEDACKALDGLVRFRSGRFDLSGTDLMQKVFRPNNPILRFNDLKTESDKSEQQGRMFPFAGAMLAASAGANDMNRGMHSGDRSAGMPSSVNETTPAPTRDRTPRGCAACR